jgi:hypothetical protein
MLHGEISIDDPRAADVRALLERSICMTMSLQAET